MKLPPFRPLRRLFGSTHGEVLFECRRCGSTVEPGTNVCPSCEQRSVARYEME
ncbi:conserved hypothetical protein (plasmid) [Halorubrum lacusprofundi ATCC 49239]|uniref:Zinc-ribbon domain-containing protein n=1 Tax=Halorubrum lacusprofundi (strain ATCC 49239 / DSM 5036 / JCM 8891 / ACAM 34) TaxID=416348 RepID=B9LWJ3_HALLT|nr:conserved hypothetical protein [Halorubrum lacusprofundi ATCC 49239]